MVTIKSEIYSNSAYVIFDGTCGFCNTSALWIARHDVGHHFLLVSNDSPFGKELLEAQGLAQVSPHSIVLIESEGKAFVRSQAIRKIIALIPGYYFLKILLNIVPLFVQNGVYSLIAQFRKWIPVRKNCEVPDAEIRKRFRV